MMETIVDILRRTMGLDATSIGLGAIERAVQHRMTLTRTPNAERYRQRLQESADELRALIDAVLVPETWFFRDRGAFAAVAVEARSPKHGAQLRYLCVPCATGEEPLSLAMTLLDAGVPGERFHIDAFDIGERFVRHAQRGVYGRNSFRGSDVQFRARYFKDTPEGCVIAPAVRAQATFKHANLLDDAALTGTQLYDAVFCRNLLIYFDAEAQLKALNKISRLLRDDGLLCVAPAETGLLLRHGFVPVEIPQAFAFRNEKRRDMAKVVVKRIEYRSPAPQLPFWSIEKRVAVDGKAPAVAEPRANDASPALPAIEEAMRLADEGRLAEVSEICRAHIEAHGGSADAYYLLALVADASGRHEEAAILYRKALYLDPQHRDALAHYSLLADKLGETATAGALRRRALRIEPNAA